MLVELSEWGSAEVDLEPSEAGALQNAGGSALTVTPLLGGGGFSLTTNSHVGSIVVGDLEVRIHPKIPAANVLLMLTRSWDRPFLGRHITGYERSDLSAAVVAMFAAAVTALLRRGAQQDYVEAAELVDAVRGRIDMVAQFRRPGQLVPIPCWFSEYTVDTPANRYLKHAVRLAMRCPGVWRETRGQLRHALAHLAPVTNAPPPADLPLRMRFTRLNRSYEPVLRLAQVIRTRVGLTSAVGGVPASSFLVNMNEVFERFIEDRLRDALAGQLLVDGQHTDHLDLERSVLIRPDLLLRDPSTGTVVAVADTKYKRTGDGLARAADYYQLHAYCTRYGLPVGTLIYATDDKAGRPTREVTTLGDGVTLWTVQVSLDGSTPALRASIEQLAEHLMPTLVDEVPAPDQRR